MGQINPNIIQRCEDIMEAEKQKTDFKPLGLELLENLKSETSNINAENTDNEEKVQKIREIVMQFKANASTFGFDLAGALANIMLTFLENIKTIDENVIEILKAHQTTLSLIVKSNMRGDCGKNGIKLQEELKSACKRYFDNQKS